jgi:hypothetical protein
VTYGEKGVLNLKPLQIILWNEATYKLKIKRPPPGTMKGVYGSKYKTEETELKNTIYCSARSMMWISF